MPFFSLPVPVYDENQERVSQSIILDFRVQLGRCFFCLSLHAIFVSICCQSIGEFSTNGNVFFGI